VAKLNHPNIVPLYRVGDDAERPYIVFQMVEGKTLGEVNLTLQAAVEHLRAVALAVAYAHGQGIVHRDLKPGNLMLDSQGRVWILDFGLAYLGESEGQLTATGAALGTPSYMSPEQARGDRSAHDRATDIYSLGATLYDLVTGRPPFEGSNFAELVNRVAHDDPPRPRKINPAIPQDLETILLKAMSREPSRRYRTAAEFAEDLARFRAGEPVAARPTSFTQRIVRTVRQRPALWSLVAAGLVGLGLTWYLVTRYQAERILALSTLRDTARVSLEAALELRRNGQNSGMRRFLEPLERAYTGAIERAPGLGEPDYQMGRLYRALLDEQTALHYQERALEKEPAYAPAHYERALLLSRVYGRKYRRALDSLRTLDPGRGSVPTRESVERMNPDLLHIRETIRHDLEALPTSDLASSLAARGILAFYQDQTREARTLLGEAVAKNPHLEEAWEALARAPLAEAERSLAIEDKERLWREAEDLYTKALDLDRGYLPHLMGRGEVRLQRGKLGRQHGRDPIRDFTLAEEDFDHALKIDERYPEAWLRRGETRASRAIHEGDAGREPFAYHDQAEKDLGRAIELDDHLAEAWMRRGIVRTNRAVFREERRLDGMADFKSADADFTRALTLDPGYADAWQWRGIGRANRGMYLNRRNENGSQDLDLGEEDLTHGLGLKPEAPGLWLWRGNARKWRTMAPDRKKDDPLPAYGKAEDDYTHAVQANPEYADAYFWRGLLRLARASVHRARGLPSAEDTAAAEEDFTQTLKINRTHVEALVQRGELRFHRADDTQGDAARKEYASAAEDLAEAVRLNPGVRSRISRALDRSLQKSKE
jgi:serine/threonine-protein kinase